jgi:DNA (cytosine-5)-methyltransferase 1
MKAIDLFSGPGGMTVGMKRAGFLPIASIDNKTDAVETYSRHTPEAEHYCDNIREISFAKYRGKAEVVFGGPPCQPFSTGGLRKGTSDPRNMMPEFLRVIDEVHPKAFVIENVPGLASKSRIEYLLQLLRELHGLGYMVSWRILLAADYGVPQKRKRLFIVGMRNTSFWFPKPTHGSAAAKSHVPAGSVISIENPLGTPPNCPVIFAKYPDPRRSPYAGHVYNGGGRPIDLQAPCHTVLASAGGYKTHWVDTQNIAPAYTKHLLNGGQPWCGEVPGARRMTIQESVLIQSFPKTMVFAGKLSSQYTQVGNAVPPLLAEALGTALIAQLSGELPDEERYDPPEAWVPLLEDAR